MIDNDIIGLQHRKDSARMGDGRVGVLPDRGLFWLWVCAWVGRGGFSKKLQVAGCRFSCSNEHVKIVSNTDVIITAVILGVLLLFPVISS